MIRWPLHIHKIQIQETNPQNSNKDENTSSKKPIDARKLIVGIDLENEEEKKKIQQRRERFKDEILVFDPQTHFNERKMVDEVEDSSVKRTDALYIYGVDFLGEREIFYYFKQFNPIKIEWLNDSSCNLVFPNAETTERAYKEAAAEREYETEWRDTRPIKKEKSSVVLEYRYARNFDVKNPDVSGKNSKFYKYINELKLVHGSKKISKQSARTFPKDGIREIREPVDKRRRPRGRPERRGRPVRGRRGGRDRDDRSESRSMSDEDQSSDDDSSGSETKERRRGRRETNKEAREKTGDESEKKDKVFTVGSTHGLFSYEEKMDEDGRPEGNPPATNVVENNQGVGEGNGANPATNTQNGGDNGGNDDDNNEPVFYDLQM
eukprot:TRINITY_DN12788_c0_g1_i3.p1 TRINITY_DN12788_c0_g1~~TRINITY_DN12788_c0_g1_i3.p1  ORF type:complete len:379 (-),score=52.26 TRINITY_DN12788_c0_g1_i3:136-1272(-)